ncbi:MAG: hypothetical protein LH629_06000 [Ignavibacteria bacterium]|nr:hypothetical protein [Ignavibacteria bacterium]
MNKTEYFYHYKDASRYHWRVKLWKIDEKLSWEGADSIDFIWNYTVERNSHGQNDWEIMYEQGFIVGQYNIPPNLKDIVLDFMNYIQSFALGFSDYEVGAKEVNSEAF